MKKYGTKYIGKEFHTNEGYIAKVIDGGSKPSTCVVKIGDWVAEKQIHAIKGGRIKYPYHKTLHGVGFSGEGKYNASKDFRSYLAWQNIMDRCYKSPNDDESKRGTVDKEWHNFQNFAKWYDRYYPKDGMRHELDKNLIGGDENLYSPRTCIFVHRKLKSFFERSSFPRGNAAGYIGVRLMKSKSKKLWEANITINGKYTKIGSFPTPEKAYEAYRKAKAKRIREVEFFFSFDYPKFVLDGLWRYDLDNRYDNSVPIAKLVLPKGTKNVISSVMIKNTPLEEKELLMEKTPHQALTRSTPDTRVVYHLQSHQAEYHKPSKAGKIIGRGATSVIYKMKGSKNRAIGMTTDHFKIEWLEGCKNLVGYKHISTEPLVGKKDGYVYKYSMLKLQPLEKKHKKYLYKELFVLTNRLYVNNNFVPPTLILSLLPFINDEDLKGQLSMVCNLFGHRDRKLELDIHEGQFMLLNDKVVLIDPVHKKEED